MTIQSTAAFRAHALAQHIAEDRRLHKRVNIPLLGRFMRENKQEYPCKLVDISVGGAAMMSPVTVDVGERIIVYFDHLGGLEGAVVRLFDGGFAIQLVSTQHKRDKLAAQITWLLNRHELTPGAERRHERFTPDDTQTTVKLSDGTMATCRVLDISISGASISTNLRPAIGEDLMLGKLRAKVVRHHGCGFAVQFLDIQQPAALRRHFV